MISAVCVLNAFVAQLDRAQASDAWCQGFESLQTHFRKEQRLLKGAVENSETRGAA